MTKRPIFAVTLAIGLAIQGTAFADVSDSSPDSGPFSDTQDFSSTINFTDLEIISDVVVTVNVRHTWVGDVTATLTHENTGTSIELIPSAIEDFVESSNLGSADGTVVATYFFADDSGLPDHTGRTIGDAAGDGDSTFDIPAGGYFASDGTATGAGSLDLTFGGENTFGDWTILFTDANGGDDGFVDGWSIDFTSTLVPEPSSVALIGLLSVAVISRRRR